MGSPSLLYLFQNIQDSALIVFPNIRSLEYIYTYMYQDEELHSKGNGIWLTEELEPKSHTTVVFDIPFIPQHFLHPLYSLNVSCVCAFAFQSPSYTCTTSYLWIYSLVLCDSMPFKCKYIHTHTLYLHNPYIEDRTKYIKFYSQSQPSKNSIRFFIYWNINPSVAEKSAYPYLHKIRIPMYGILFATSFHSYSQQIIHFEGFSQK